MLNAHEHDVDFLLPSAGEGKRWTALIETVSASPLQPGVWYAGGAQYVLRARSAALLVAGS
jgi:hypothetical protein